MGKKDCQDIILRLLSIMVAVGVAVAGSVMAKFISRIGGTVPRKKSRVELKARTFMSDITNTEHP